MFWFNYALDENYASYVPKPCLFYMYDQKTSTSNIKFNNGASTVNITDYKPFGQDLQVNSVNDYSLNWGAEISPLLLQTIPYGLFATYYFNYLANLYQIGNKLYKVKMILPISLLTKLQLNDRLIIRDKRYIINDIKSNLTSGESNLTLIEDFRPTNPALVIDTGGGANCVQVAVALLSGAISATITTTTSGVTITPSTITSNQSVAVCVPANANTTTYIMSEGSNPLFPIMLRKFMVTEGN